MSVYTEDGFVWEEGEEDGPTVLHVEDDENDALLLQVSLWKSQLPIRLRWVRGGRAAIDYLTGRGAYGDRMEHPMPALVFLDLKMPDVPGLSVLEWMGKQQGLRALPVVVLSASALEFDRQEAGRLGAKDYVVKASGFRQSSKALREVCRRWLDERGAKG